MSPPVMSCEEVRALEKRAAQELGMPTLLLMENAGRGVAEVLINLRANEKGSVVILCGKGNNGGDGFVVARHLDNLGILVRVLLFAEPGELSGDAAINYAIISKSGLDVKTVARPGELSAADWVVDALFGSGLKGALRPPYDQIVADVNASGARVLAIDIPSGLNGDTGKAEGVAIQAKHTVSLIAIKKGLLEESAKEWTGEVHYHDAGLPRSLLASGN